MPAEALAECCDVASMKRRWQIRAAITSPMGSMQLVPPAAVFPTRKKTPKLTPTTRSLAVALITPPPAGCRIYRVAVVCSLGASQTSVPAKRAQHEEGESVVTGRTWLSPVTLRPIFSVAVKKRVLAFTTCGSVTPA
jgi:hypothetical protein